MTKLQEQKKLQQLLMLREERELLVQQVELFENTVEYCKKHIERKSCDIKEIEQELLDDHNVKNNSTIACGDIVYIASTDDWGLVQHIYPDAIPKAAIAFPSGTGFTYTLRSLTKLIDLTPVQIKFQQAYLHDSQIKAQSEPNQSNVQQVSTEPVREQAVGLSEGEGHGSTSSADDFHGHPGLLRGQCRSRLRIAPTPPSPIPSWFNVHWAGFSRDGLHSAVPSSGQFANYQSGQGIVHQ